MAMNEAIKARVLQWLTSNTHRQMARSMTGLKRRLLFNKREVLYFHRADDPYCQLMVQVLPELIKRFNITVTPLVVERLPANMYPDPRRYEAYGIIDAARLGALYGIGFPKDATVPDHLSSRMANNFLAEHQNSEDFFRLAADIGAALWRRGVVALQEICGDALIYHDARLRKNEAQLASLGHYASASLFYGGEVYVGLDRLDHLETRLNDEGIGDGLTHYDLTKRWMRDIIDQPMDADDQRLEFFFSVRSPYSYLGLVKLQHLMEHTGCEVTLRPVLPMVMRGLKVPNAKLRYIIDDTAREADAADIAFGRFVDPLGGPVLRAMAIGTWAISMGKGLAFFTAFTRAHFAEGKNTLDDAVMEKLLEEVGLPVPAGMRALSDNSWQETVEENRLAMLRLGHWGVPVIRHGEHTVWGQDRFFAICQRFRASAE